MSNAVGYALLPVTLSIRGAQQQLTKELVAPAQAAAKKASDSVRKQLSSGAEQAAKAVESARKREENATKRVVDAEKSLKLARDAAEQKVRAVESAELKLQAARANQTAKITAAESSLKKLRDSGKATTDQIIAAEANLEQVRSSQGAKVIDAESRVQRARGASVAAADQAAAAEDRVTTAKTRAVAASAEVISATRKMDAAQAAANATGTKTEGVFARIKAKAAELSAQVKNAGSSARSASSDMSAFGSSAQNQLSSARGASDLFIGSVGRIGAAIAALAGPVAAFAGGWKRATGFQEAEIRFKSIDVQGKQFTDTMDMLNNVVKGTSAGLDEAAQQASMLMTSGVNGGKELEDSMSALVTASAVGGRSVGELGLVFQQVSAAGKLQAGDALQLSQASVPIWSWLSKTMGKSVAEVRKMSEAGEISYNDMVKAIKENGGSLAKDMSGTFKGQVSLLTSSISRMGEIVATPILHLSNKVLPALTAAFDAVGKAIKSVKAWFEQGSAAANILKGAFAAIGTVAAISAIAGIVSVIKGLLTTTKLATLATTLFSGALKMLVKHPVLMALAAVVGALTWFFTSTETGRKTWDKLMDALKSAWKWLKDTFSPIFATIGDAARSMWDGAIEAAQPFILVFGTVKNAWDELTSAFSGGDWGYGALSKIVGADNAEWVVNAVANVGTAWEEITRAFSGEDWGYGALASIIGADRAEWVVNIVASVGDALGKVWDVIKQIPELAGGVWDILFKGDFTGLPFGLEEDSGIVTFLLTLRDVAIQVSEALQNALSGAFAAVRDALKDLGPAVFDIAKALGGAFMDAAKGVLEAVGGLWDGLKSLWDALSPMLLPVLKIVGAVLGGVVLGAIFAVVGALKIFAGVVEIAAKVVAWFAANVLGPLISGMGKVAEIIGTVVGGAFRILGETVKWVWESVIKPVWDVLSTAATILAAVVLTALIAPFLIAWNLLSEGIKMAWETRIKPAWEALSMAAQWLWDSVLKPTFSFIKAKWDEISVGIQWAWTALIQPAWNAMSTSAQWLFNNVLKPTFGFIKAKWDELAQAISTIWNTVIRPVWEFFGSVISDVVEAKVKPAFEAVKYALGKVGDFFGTVVSGIKTVWDGLRAILAKPINFLINTVYMGGIKPAWDAVGKFLPIPEAASIKPIPEHAVGGAIRGPGSGTSDDVLMWGSNGEHMLTAAEVKKMGGQGSVYAMRHMIESGRAFSFDGHGGLVSLPNHTNSRAGDLAGIAPGLLLPGFKKGGEIRPAWQSQLENGHRAAKMRDGHPYTWGFEDCSGYMSAIADAIINGGDGKWTWATGSFPGGQPWVKGLGEGFSVGVHDNPGGPGGGHTAGTLTGVGNYSTTNVESGGGHGYVAYGGPAVGADNAQFSGVSPGQFHLAIGADGAFESAGGPSPAQKSSWLRDKVKELFGEFLDPVDAVIDARVGTPPPEILGVPRKSMEGLKDGAIDFLIEKVSSLGDLLGGAYDKAKKVTSTISDGLGNVFGGLFDSGGMLQPGTSITQNKTGKPEPVLTHGQWLDVAGIFNGISKLVPQLRKFTPELQEFVGENPKMQNAIEIGNESIASFVEKHQNLAAEAAQETSDGVLDFFGMKGTWFTDLSTLGVEWGQEDTQGQGADQVPAPEESAEVTAQEPQTETKKLDNSTVINFTVENIQASDPNAAAREMMREARRVLAAYA